MSTIDRTHQASTSALTPSPRPYAEFMQIWEEGYVSNRISFEIMHTPGVFIVRGAALRTTDGDIDRAKIMAFLAATVGSAPMFRLRLQRSFLGLTPPAWVPDEHFDLSRHVVFAEDSVDLTTADLRSLSGDYDGAMPIDHPLWRMRVTGLTNGDVAVGSVLHHASLDGLSGMKAMSVMNLKSPGAVPSAPVDPFVDVRAARAWELPFLSLVQWWRALPAPRLRSAWRSYWAKPVVRRARRVAARLLLPLRYEAGGEAARSAALPPRHSAYRQIDSVHAGRRARELGGTLSDLLMAATIGAWDGREREVKLRFPVSFHSDTAPKARNNVRDMEITGDADAPLEMRVASVHAQVAARDTAWDGHLVPGAPIGYTTLLPWVSRPRYFCGGEVMAMVPFPASLGTDRLAAAGIMYNGSLFIGANMPVNADVEATIGRIYQQMTGFDDPGRP
jgi:hypothetical protein